MSYQVATAPRKTVAVVVTSGAVLAATAGPARTPRVLKRPTGALRQAVSKAPVSSVVAVATVCQETSGASTWMLTVLRAALEPSVPANASGCPASTGAATRVGVPKPGPPVTAGACA